MRRYVELFITLNRGKLLFAYAVLSLAVFGIVTPQITTAQISQCSVTILYPFVGPLPTDVFGAAAASDGNSIYAAGGYSSSVGGPVRVFNRLDPYAAFANWTPLAPMPTAVVGGAAVFNPDINKIFVFGGADANSDPTNLTQIYDITTNVWTLGPNMPAVRASMAAVYFNHRDYMFGGNDLNQAATSVWEYDDLKRVFITTRQPVPIGVTGAGFGITSDGHVYLGGGKDTPTTATRSLFDYYIPGNFWTRKADAPFPIDFGASWSVRVHRVFQQLSDELIFSGGGTPGDPNAAGVRTQIYDRTMDTWRQGPNLNVGRFAPTGTAIGNTGFVIGGYNGITTISSTELLPLICKIPFTDFDGDGLDDMSVERQPIGELDIPQSQAAWYIQRSQAGFYGTLFGLSDDKIAPSDYDGDNKTDIAVYRPSNGTWYVLRSSDGTVAYYRFGIAEDLPTPADYDGDGKADIAVFRPSTGTWYRQNSSDGSFFAVQFGTNGDKPALGDFDGDNKADVSVYRPSTSTWYRINSSNGTQSAVQFGISTDVIVPADYDGDGKTDVAVYRPSTGTWYVTNSINGAVTYNIFGLATDIPTPGDFDGDGKADISVFRPSNGTWYRKNSSNGTFTSFPFGTNGDKPIQTAFRY